MTDALWTIDELVAATGGTLHGTATACTGVTFDSRDVKAGDLFVALDGAKTGGVRDGHDFVAGAHASSAALSIVDRLVPDGGPQLVVADTLAALTDIAVAARTRAPAKRVAVTGSVGKTGVTRAIEAGLRLAGPAHAPVGSFNNHIGVPLTMARMPRGTTRAVFEIGMNHADEITPLSRLVQPHVAVITTVGAVHTENFPDGEEGVARAKAEIFDGLLPGGIAVLNRDNRWFDLLADAAHRAGAVVQSFGTHEDSDARLLGRTDLPDGMIVHAEMFGQKLDIEMRQSGEHWAMNSLAVMLALAAMDVPQATALAALATYAPQDGRGALHDIKLPGGGSVRLIDESYNANPMSMNASLANLGAQAMAIPGRRIAALTDMLELGDQSPRWHAELADTIAARNIDLVFCAGPLMENLWNTLPAARRGAYAPTAKELAPTLQAALKNGDVVMVKGSKGSKASLLTATLLGVVNP